MAKKKVLDYDVRVLISGLNETETSRNFTEMCEYLKPVKKAGVMKMLINKAYEYWFEPEILKKSNT